MEVIETAAIAGVEISGIESRVDEKQLKQLMEKTRRAKKIYVCSAGRSLLMLHCFAMRPMYVGYGAYVVGDTTIPAFEEGDFLIVGAASGETANLISIADRAKSYGGIIAVCSIFPGSSLGKRTNALVGIPTCTNELPESDDNRENVLPGGSMSEISILMLFDTMTMPLAEEKSVTTNMYFTRHANLE